MALVAFLRPVRVEIPHEPGNWMEFRKPASGVVQEARKVVEAEGRRGVRDFGAEIVRAFNSGDDDDRAAARAAKLAKLQEYDPSMFDRATLLGGCLVDGAPCAGAIVAWGGPAYIGPDGAIAAITHRTIADLDEETARWAIEHVIGLMKPPTQEADKRTPDAVVSSA